MPSTLSRIQPWSNAEREQHVNGIRARAHRWRLLDASEEALERMLTAIDTRMAELEEQLEEADNSFAQFTEVGDLERTQEAQDQIDRLHSTWSELQQRRKAVNNALQERRLRSHLIAVLGTEQRLLLLDLLVFIAIVLVVILTLVELMIPLPLETITRITTVDTTICLLLLGDFFLRLSLADDRRWYFRNYWIDFVSSIPFYGILRFGRLVRVARFARVLRLLRLSRALRVILFVFRGLDKLFKTFELNLLKRSLLIALALLLFGALSITALEGARSPDIAEFDDSIWWSFSTIVTGGFADLYNPITPYGRIITTMMILLGLTVTGIFTASLTSVLVEDDSTRIEHSQDAMQAKLDTIEGRLELLSGDTNQALIALEKMAQLVSNEPSPQILAQELTSQLTKDFHGLQASVHVLDAPGASVVRIAQSGDTRSMPPERIPLGEGFVGYMAEHFSRGDVGMIDLEPQSKISSDRGDVISIYPMVAGGRFLGLLHMVLPKDLSNVFLYTRIPMTLAHQVALAFHAAEQADRNVTRAEGSAGNRPTGSAPS